MRTNHSKRRGHKRIFKTSVFGDIKEYVVSNIMESFKEVKFILLGDGNVGKTCLMLSFTGKAFRVSHINTIGIDMEKKIVDFDGSALQVTIWDTAGQERYRNSIPKNIFKRLNGALLVFDVTNRRSFNSMNS